MPTSKKPRKAYVARHRPTYAFYLPEKNKERLKELFTNIECIVEVKLPRGTCNMDDVRMMRDMLNLATALLHLGHHMVDDASELVRPEWKALQDAFCAFYKRAQEERKFTCYASEINAMREGFEIAGQIVRDEFEREPAWVLDCFYGLTEFLDRGDGKRITVESSTLEDNIMRIRARRLSPRAIREGR